MFGNVLSIAGFGAAMSFIVKAGCEHELLKRYPKLLMHQLRKVLINN